VCEQQLLKAGIPANIMIDCSHANSNKDHNLQPLVMKNVANQIIDGNNSIIGLMVESNIKAGNQSIPEDRSKLEYGVSVTDKCIDWETTEEMMQDLRDSVKDILPKRRALNDDDLIEQSA
jgi:3-deoxy-7-phosphoheptulonate synthase